MTRLRPPRGSLLVLLALGASLLSCGREVTGPGGRGVPASVALDPRFPEIRLAGTGEVLGIGSVVPFERVRVVLRRADGSIAVDQLVDFPAGQETVTLSFTVNLSPGAPSTGEPLTATMRYINAAGDTVFAGGPLSVTARPATGSNPPPPVEVPISYSGPGANAASIVIAPDSFIGTINQTNPFTATVLSASQTPMPGTPVAFTSTDSSRVRVGLATGVATLIGARGSALIIAQTLTGQADTALVRITPTPSALVLVSGGGQQALQGAAFPNPVRVRVNAADGLGVQGVTVAFTPVAGAGTVSAPTAVTDAQGEAQVTWTAGTTIGPVTLNVSIPATTITLAVPGTQLSSAPASLAFSASPANFTAGDTIPPFSVTVRDVLGGTVLGFNGQVSLSLTGGTAGASLVGVAARNAVNGVATFPGLTVNRGGSAYRIVATVTGVPTAQTNAFDVAAAPPRFLTLLSGGGQTAPPSTPLADSVAVRVTDAFGFPIAGLNVAFAVTAGGGSVSPTAVATDANGRAAARWTIGAAGTQQLTATAGALTPLTVTATVFTGGGTPQLFIGATGVGTSIGVSRGVPVYISPAPSTTVVATLTMRDTLVARWDAATTTFTPGVGLRTPTLTGVGFGSTYAVVTSSAGTDSVFVGVDSVSLRIGSFNTYRTIVGDTLPFLVRLSAPAPAGGRTVVVRSSDSSLVKVAAGSGRTPPADGCQLYCFDLQAAPSGEVTILGTPADSAVVTIPAGQLAAYVVVLPVAPAGGQFPAATLSASSANVASTIVTIDAAVGTLFRYGWFTASESDPIPVGHRNAMDLEFYDALTREVRVRITSRNPAVVRTDTLVVFPAGDQRYNIDGVVYYDGVTVGSTWLVVEAPGFRTDSFPVSVVPGYLVMPNYGFTVGVGHDLDLYGEASGDSVSLGNYNYPPRGSTLPITATSSNPAVAAIRSVTVIEQDEYHFYVHVRAVATGTAWIRVAAPGYATDSVPVTVTAASFLVNETYFRVGAGQVHESMNVYLGSGGTIPGTGLVATVASSDTSRLAVLTPQVPFNTNNATPAIRLLGKAPGSANVIISVPGMASDVRAWTVTTPDLFINTFGSGGTIDADSAQWVVGISMRDGVNVARAAADTVIGVLRSLDPAVLLVTDSIVRFVPGSFSSNTARIRAVAPGSARFVVEAPGFAPDTSGAITLRPRRLEWAGLNVVHGRNLETSVSLSRRSPPGGPLPLTITRQGSAGLVLAQPTDTIPAGLTARTIRFRALDAMGTDTVIAAAPGHASDTIYVTVGASLIQLFTDGYGYVGDQDDFVSAALRPTSIFSYRPASDTVRLRLESTDTTIIRVLRDTILIAAGATSPTSGGYGSVRYLRPGIAWLRVVDPLGRFEADSTEMFVYLQSLSMGAGVPTIGIRQQSTPYEGYVYRPFSSPTPLWVRLTSSSPASIAVTDSIEIPAFSSYAYYSVTAGDSVGSAVVTASAPGYTEVTTEYHVVRPALAVSGLQTPSLGGIGRVELYVTDAAFGYTRSSLDTIPLRIRTDDPSIAVAVDSLPQFLPGESAIDVDAVRGVAPGRSGVAFEDRRPTALFRRVLPTRLDFEIGPALLRFPSWATTARVGLGTTATYDDHYIHAPNGGPGDWVRFTSRLNRVRVPGDSVFLDPAGGVAYFRIAGLAEGVDTLIATAPGYAPDTLVLDVSRSLVDLSTYLPPTIRVGDSVQVTLRLQQLDGYSVAQAAGAPLDLTFGTSGGIELRAVGGGALTTAAIPVGASSISFYVRATGPAGGSFTVTGPSIVTFQRGVATRP